MEQIKNRTVFLKGMHDGVPVALGYFAVSFSLGIAARKAGLSAVQAFVVSLLCNASAGEYAGFTLIAAGAPYFEVALMTFIANARYMLMSCALSQRLAPGTKLGHRLVLGNYVTDELFGLAIAQPGDLNPYYTYGSVCIASPCWALGTALGTVAGSLLPAMLVNALGVALYGMFLAVIIPPARKSKIIAGLVTVSFVASYAVTYLPVMAGISAGTRTIILTVVLSAGAAILFPKKQETEASPDAT